MNVRRFMITATVTLALVAPAAANADVLGSSGSSRIVVAKSGGTQVRLTSKQAKVEGARRQEQGARGEEQALAAKNKALAATNRTLSDRLTPYSPPAAERPGRANRSDRLPRLRDLHRRARLHHLGFQLPARSSGGQPGDQRVLGRGARCRDARRQLRDELPEHRLSVRARRRRLHVDARRLVRRERGLLTARPQASAGAGSSTGADRGRYDSSTLAGRSELDSRSCPPHARTARYRSWAGGDVPILASRRSSSGRRGTGRARTAQIMRRARVRGASSTCARSRRPSRSPHARRCEPRGGFVRTDAESAGKPSACARSTRAWSSSCPMPSPRRPGTTAIVSSGVCSSTNP